MGVQIVHHQVPALDLWRAFYQPFQMRNTVLFTTSGTPGRFANLAGSDIQVDIPGERSMPKILKFPPQDV